MFKHIVNDIFVNFIGRAFAIKVDPVFVVYRSSFPVSMHDSVDEFVIMKFYSVWIQVHSSFSFFGRNMQADGQVRITLTDDIIAYTEYPLTIQLMTVGLIGNSAFVEPVADDMRIVCQQCWPQDLVHELGPGRR